MIVNCKTASSLISESFERHLSLYQRLQLKIHLFLCRYVGGNNCKNYLDQILVLQKLAGTWSEESLSLDEVKKLKLSSEYKKKIKKVLAQTAGKPNGDGHRHD